MESSDDISFSYDSGSEFDVQPLLVGMDVLPSFETWSSMVLDFDSFSEFLDVKIHSRCFPTKEHLRKYNRDVERWRNNEFILFSGKQFERNDENADMYRQYFVERKISFSDLVETKIGLVKLPQDKLIKVIQSALSLDGMKLVVYVDSTYDLFGKDGKIVEDFELDLETVNKLLNKFTLNFKDLQNYDLEGSSLSACMGYMVAGLMKGVLGKYSSWLGNVHDVFDRKFSAIMARYAKDNGVAISDGRKGLSEAEIKDIYDNSTKFTRVFDKTFLDAAKAAISVGDLSKKLTFRRDGRMHVTSVTLGEFLKTAAKFDPLPNGLQPFASRLKSSISELIRRSKKNHPTKPFVVVSRRNDLMSSELDVRLSDTIYHETKNAFTIWDLREPKAFEEYNESTYYDHMNRKDLKLRDVYAIVNVSTIPIIEQGFEYIRYYCLDLKRTLYLVKIPRPRKKNYGSSGFATRRMSCVLVKDLFALVCKSVKKFEAMLASKNPYFGTHRLSDERFRSKYAFSAYDLPKYERDKVEIKKPSNLFDGSSEVSDDDFYADSSASSSDHGGQGSKPEYDPDLSEGNDDGDAPRSSTEENPEETPGLGEVDESSTNLAKVDGSPSPGPVKKKRKKRNSKGKGSRKEIFDV